MILERSFRYAMARLKIQPGRFRSAKWTAGKLDPPRRNYDYELAYFSGGKGRVIVDNAVYSCRAGTLIIIPPDVEHCMICETALERWSFHFDWFGDCRAHWEGDSAFVYTDSGERFNPDFCAAPPPPELGLTFPLYCTLPEKTAEEFLEVLRKYFMLIPVSLSDAFERTSHLLRLLSIALAVSPEPPQMRKKRFNLRFARAKNLFDARFQEPRLQISDVAETLHITTNHLSKLFRQEVGMSALDYLQGVRLEYAIHLLRDHSLTVQEIAHESGFETANYFTRLFRRKTGMTPSAFRKQNFIE